MQESLYTKQQYSAYTTENFQVWKMLYQNLEAVHEVHACAMYLENKKRLGFSPHTIPNFEEINQILLQTNGWEVVAVDGLLEADSFLYLLSEKKFPVTPWIRPLENAYSYDDADMLHDMIGHIPFLLDPLFSEFLYIMGKVVVEHEFDKEIMDIISRIFWWTIEVGLVYENGNPKIYGAALLSSLGESVRSVSKATPRFDFSFDTCVRSSFSYDKEQDRYYVLSSFNELLRTIEKLKGMRAISLY